MACFWSICTVTLASGQKRQSKWQLAVLSLSFVFQEAAAAFMSVWEHAAVSTCVCTHAPSLLISNLNAARRKPCSTHALSKGEEVSYFKPCNQQFYSIQSFLQRTLQFQTSEGTSHPICIALKNSFGNEKETYARTHRHASTDTLENSDKKLAEHKNTFSSKINPRTGCLQFFPYLNNHSLCFCLSNRNMLLYLGPMNLFSISLKPANNNCTKIHIKRETYKEEEVA